MYETLGGQCKDSSCQSQHLRDIELSDDEYLCKLLKIYIINNNNINDLKESLQKMRKNNESISTLTSFLISKINKKDNLSFDINDISNENSINTLNDEVNKNVDVEEKYDDKLKINNSINLGFYSLLEKEKIQRDRYFNKEISSNEYEKLLNKNSKDVELWIKYAVSLLPPEINKENIGKLNTKFDKALNILSRALDQNNDSSAIWNLYMDLYVHREDAESIREIFEQLIFIIPREPWCGWSFLSWEKIYQNKIIILKKMLNNFIKINEDQKKHSHLILEILIHIIKTIDNKKGNKEARKFFMKVLSSHNNETLINCFEENKHSSDNEQTETETEITKTYLFKILKSKDFLLLYLMFIHFYEYNSFPEEIFFAGSRTYLIHDELFTIKWGDSKPKEFDRYINIFENLLNKWPVNEKIENNEVYLAIWINFMNLGKFFNFDKLNSKVLKLLENKNETIKEIVFSLQKEHKFKQDMNEYQNTFESNNESELKLSLNLYKKLLGLPLPYDIILPSLKDEFTKIIRYLQNDINIIFNYLIFISYNRDIEENPLQQTINDLTYNLLLNNSKFSIFIK
ncbi:hypothetical protein BCR36DRAFT_281775 [Piromyces finnis]|uniref:Putative zinc-finger domain-containing protein n=1 Tax=Piromyces finnis TaxID=1754191 RepID=A0A1Y1VGG2_9FUNG|nr:hypothetical protein BCR36DRAFT_281775 [Piromyces finnis]|eukprot:ORX55516.1 hypothetical protein BCR36DRAFT_281775 [Piromyces finnis]